jgi:hypothetical protein
MVDGGDTWPESSPYRDGVAPGLFVSTNNISSALIPKFFSDGVFSAQSWSVTYRSH